MGVVVGLGLGLGLLRVVGPPQAAGHRATEDVPVAKTCGLEEHPESWQMRAIEPLTSRLEAAE